VHTLLLRRRLLEGFTGSIKHRHVLLYAPPSIKQVRRDNRSHGGLLHEKYLLGSASARCTALLRGGGGADEITGVAHAAPLRFGRTRAMLCSHQPLHSALADIFQDAFATSVSGACSPRHTSVKLMTVTTSQCTRVYPAREISW
jgi:hypothetical protein